MRYAFVRAHTGRRRVTTMCRVLMVSKAGYYAWRVRDLSDRRKRDADLHLHVVAFHRKSSKRYGSRPILRDLRDIGEHVSRKRVVRIMRAARLSGKRRRAFRITTDSKHNHPIPGNHLDRHYGPILKATAETKYPIKTVTVNEASQTLGVPIGTSIQAGPWPVPQPAMDTCLAGTECVWGGAKAAAWTFSVTSPQQGAGEIAGAQIIEQWYGSQNAAGDQANYCTSATASLNALQFWLDNGFPYPEVAPTSFAGGAKATWTADDSPYTAWLYVQAAGDANNVAAWRTSYFQDFFMYRPTATGSRGSIWVTIEKSTWNFADSWTEASPVPGPFAEGFPVSKLAVTGTAPAVSTTLPTWTNAATNAGDPPCPQGQIITAAGRKIK